MNGTLTLQGTLRIVFVEGSIVDAEFRQNPPVVVPATPVLAAKKRQRSSSMGKKIDNMTGWIIDFLLDMGGFCTKTELFRPFRNSPTTMNAALKRSGVVEFQTISRTGSGRVPTYFVHPDMIDKFANFAAKNKMTVCRK